MASETRTVRSLHKEATDLAQDAYVLEESARSLDASVGELERQMTRRALEETIRGVARWRIQQRVKRQEGAE